MPGPVRNLTSRFGRLRWLLDLALLGSALRIGQRRLGRALGPFLPLRSLGFLPFRPFFAFRVGGLRPGVASNLKDGGFLADLRGRYRFGDPSSQLGGLVLDVIILVHRDASGKAGRIPSTGWSRPVSG